MTFPIDELKNKITQNFNPLQKAYEVAFEMIEEYELLHNHFHLESSTYSVLPFNLMGSENKPIDQGIDLAHKVQKTYSISRRIRELKYNIHSIYYLINGKTANEILSDLKRTNWNHKHQIITRWAWMQYHQNHLSAKHRSKYPYRCNLGDWDKWLTEDYEFYVLLNFLPIFQNKTKKQFLFHSRPQMRQLAPDFILSNQKNSIGMEMTIAPQFDNLGQILTHQARFESLLEDKFHEAKFGVLIKEIAKWHFALVYIHDIISAIELAYLLKKSKRIKKDRYHFRSLSCRIIPSKSVIHLSFSKEDKKILSLDIILNRKWFLKVRIPQTKSKEKDIHDCANAIIKRMQIKSLKISQDSILVIWPINEFTDIDYRDVYKETQILLKSIKLNRPFNQTWLFTGKNAFLI